VRCVTFACGMSHKVISMSDPYRAHVSARRFNNMLRHRFSIEWRQGACPAVRAFLLPLKGA
jgi:hypothetical protein